MNLMYIVCLVNRDISRLKDCKEVMFSFCLALVRVNITWAKIFSCKYYCQGITVKFITKTNRKHFSYRILTRKEEL